MQGIGTGEVVQFVVFAMWLRGVPSTHEDKESLLLWFGGSDQSAYPVCRVRTAPRRRCMSVCDLQRSLAHVAIVVTPRSGFLPQ